MALLALDLGPSPSPSTVCVEAGRLKVPCFSPLAGLLLSLRDAKLHFWPWVGGGLTLALWLKLTCHFSLIV